MSEIETPELLASPDLSTPWVPLWPLQPTAPVGLYPIFDTTLAALANDIDITNIPQTFRTLKLIASLRTTEAALLTVVGAQFNGDTAATYFNQQVRGFGTAADAAAAALGNTFAKLGNMNGATATAGYHAALVAEIPYYSGAQPKTALSRWTRWSDDTQTEAGQVGSIWKQVAAINRIRIFPAAGQFVAGCRLTLYGLDPVAPVIPTINPSYGTSFPASPVSGQEHILVDSVSNPSYQWRFRYNAGSTSPYKWEYIGGTSATNAVNAEDGSTPSSGAYINLPAGAGPQLTIPRAGEYEVTINAKLRADGSGGGHKIGLKLGAAAVAITETVGGYMGAAEGGASLTMKRTAAAGDIWLVQYMIAQTSNCWFANRALFVRPVRVS